jgi:hypothetical protein
MNAPATAHHARLRLTLAAATLALAGLLAAIIAAGAVAGVIDQAAWATS